MVQFTITPFEGTYEEAVNIFKDLFIDSVKLHLRSDVEVGSALSGGVDSSSIVCVIDQLLKECGGRQKHFLLVLLIIDMMRVTG